MATYLLNIYWCHLTFNALSTLGVPSFGPSSKVRYKNVGFDNFLTLAGSKLQSTE